MDGAYLIDKPAGPTSHDVVYGVRRGLPKKTKVGHAGTLDPFATGLLIVLVGRATRAQRFLMGLDKSYEVRAQLGWTSTTGDPEGELAQTGRVEADFEHLPSGRISQRPPAYSAIKIGGKRAYERARAGEDFEIAEREVTISRFELLHRDADSASFAIDCSSGTYVRSLIADLGDAYCTELRRTAIGPFSVTQADPERLLSLTEVLGPVLTTVHVDENDAARIATGRPIAGEADAEVLVVDHHGAVAIAAPAEAGTIKPVVGFRG